MKRIFALLLMLSVLFVSVSASPAKLIDNADLLDEDDFIAVQSELENERDFDIVILTVNSLGGKGSREYADDYYDSNGYSVNGVLLLVCMGSREWYLSTAGACIERISSYDVEDHVIGYLSGGEYRTAFDMFIQLCDARMNGGYGEYDGYGDHGDYGEYDSHAYTEPHGNDFKWLTTALISLVLGFIIALIAVTVMKGKLKTVHFQRDALNYAGDLQLTLQRDTFLYRQVTRVRLPENDNDTHSHGGGGVHMSSGGVSHGGGGGRF